VLGADAVDVCADLIDKSLLRATDEGGEARIAMLETIREYAAERSAEATETEEVSARHAEHFASVAEAGRHAASDPRGDEILDAIDRDLGNIRAAIDWSIRAGRTDVGLRIATPLSDFWHLRSHITEGVRLLEALVEASADQGDSVLRARGLIVAGGLYTWLGKGEEAVRLAEAGTAMAERLGDMAGVAIGKSSLGWGLFFAQRERAQSVFIEGLEAAKQAGDDQIAGEVLMGLTWVHLRSRQLDEADRRATQVVELGGRIGTLHLVAFAHLSRGTIRATRGDLQAAIREYAQGLRFGLQVRAGVAIALGLDCFAGVANMRGDLERAARLAGAADKIRADAGGGASFSGFGFTEPLDDAAANMPRPAFEAAAASGRALSIDEAVALALEDASTDGTPQDASRSAV
jgi:hypothetical protein